MKRTRDHGLLADISSLLLCGLVGGLVLALAALPFVAGVGFGAKKAADAFDSLPSDLAAPPQLQSTQLYASDGTFITSFFDQNRTYVKLADIPVVMQHAIIAGEDSRFYHHNGVDAKGIVRAVVANRQSGEFRQGASTLTQQYVRQVLVQKAGSIGGDVSTATQKSMARKIQEARYAISLENKISKEEILERYLNIAYFGNQSYGIEAAAQSYFSQPAKDLTLAESAMLAGLVQSPSQYDPTLKSNGTKPALDRRSYVLARMLADKYITADEKVKAEASSLGLKPRKAPRSCANIRTNPQWGFFCDWFKDWWLSNPAFGKTESERLQALETGGYKIKTSLDPVSQASAQKAVDSNVSYNSPAAAGVVLVEPGTGRVKAMALNRSYSNDSSKNPRDSSGRRLSYPNTVNKVLGGSTISPGVQAGSTFKMFVMVAALERGMPLSTKINSPYQYCTHYPGNNNGRYCPKNAAKLMTGTHTMWSAFGESVNTYFIQLQERVGVKAGAEAAEKMGAGLSHKPPVGTAAKKKYKSLYQQIIAENQGSFTLGNHLVTPLDMASAYATLAARGKHCDATPIASATDYDGKALPNLSKPQCKQVIPAEVADAATNAARCPTGQKALSACSLHNGSTARSVGNSFGDRQVAGKTGSTEGNNSLWFAGYTPNFAGASFIANVDSPTQSVGRYDGKHTRIFSAAMLGALQGKPKLTFKDPPSNLTTGISVKVPDVAGDSVEQGQRTLENSGFTVRVDEQSVNSALPAGQIAYTDPAGGSRIAKNSFITIFVSNGNPAPPVTATPSPSGPATTRPAGRKPRITTPPNR